MEKSVKNTYFYIISLQESICGKASPPFSCLDQTCRIPSSKVVKSYGECNLESTDGVVHILDIPQYRDRLKSEKRISK